MYLFHVLDSCVLTVLTESGRVFLYTPPASTALKWKLVDISSPLSVLLHQCSSESTRNGDVQKNGGKKTSNEKDHSSKKSKRMPKGSKSLSNDQNETSTMEGPRAKRAKLLSAIYKDAADDSATVERLGVAAATCAWLPTLLTSPDGGSAGVIAMATRLGSVAFVGLKLPISEK